MAVIKFVAICKVSDYFLSALFPNLLILIARVSVKEIEPERETSEISIRFSTLPPVKNRIVFSLA